MRHVAEKDLVRRTGSKEVHRRVFIACEGYKTEVHYFERLVSESGRLGLYGRVEVVVMNRYRPERGISDPKRLLEMCIDHMTFLETKMCTSNLFRSIVLDAAGEEHKSMIDSMMGDRRISDMTDDDGFLNDFHEAAEFASDYLSERGVEVSVVFDDHMYDPETDIVFLVVDRDQGKERPAESYLGFLAGCYDSGFRPVVTNPRFELWELMHMDDVERDLMEISESRNPSSALKKIMKRRSMDKDDPDYDYLVDHLDNAMRNSVPYVLNPDKLESEVGTNMPDIIGVLKGTDTRS